jgi:hypothetical protein
VRCETNKEGCRCNFSRLLVGVGKSVGIRMLCEVEDLESFGVSGDYHPIMYFMNLCYLVVAKKKWNHAGGE